MWKELIGIIVVAVISIIVVIPVINDVSSTIPSDSPGYSIASIMLKGFPVFIAITVILMVSGLFSGIGSTDEELLDFEEDEDEPEEEPVMEQIKKARKSAFEILAERYARGEITDEQYTEAMSRL